MKMWVDPPAGWMFHFPAIWDDEKELLRDCLIRNGYPEKDAGFGCEHCRIWSVDENPSNP